MVSKDEKSANERGLVLECLSDGLEFGPVRRSRSRLPACHLCKAVAKVRCFFLFIVPERPARTYQADNPDSSVAFVSHAIAYIVGNTYKGIG